MDCRTFADGRIMQIAYVTDDIERSVRDFGREFGIGGWAIVRNVAFSSMELRGEPCDAQIAGAVAFQGTMMFEFIQPLDERPSVYRDRESNALLLGFHHVARVVPDLASEIAYYRTLGYETAMKVTTNTGTLAAYVERAGAKTGMIEMLEMSASVDALIGGVAALEMPLKNGEVTITYM